MARLRELLLPLVFSIFQIIYTWYGFERLQYEELAESIRAPVLLASHTIYDGISSNVGWYALCAIFYKTFGFNPFAVKVARLVLHFVGLFILARFFQKKLPIQKACILLCLISLSPTLLYFNTYQASYGSDLQFLPLVWILCFSQKQITRFVGGLVFCVATLSYPPVLFFAVPLSIIKISRGEFHYEILLAYLFMFLGFVLFLHDPMRWIWDPTVQAGVLRGGGGSIHIHMGVWSQNFKRLLVDLFVTGKSYAFSIPGTEFSGALGILGFIGISTIFFYSSKRHFKVN